jgi:hypothetical protein
MLEIAKRRPIDTKLSFIKGFGLTWELISFLWVKLILRFASDMVFMAVLCQALNGIKQKLSLAYSQLSQVI